MPKKTRSGRVSVGPADRDRDCRNGPQKEPGRQSGIQKINQEQKNDDNQNQSQ